jgi:hypothetical protein
MGKKITVFQPRAKPGLWQARLDQTFTSDTFDNPCDALLAFLDGETVDHPGDTRGSEGEWRRAANGTFCLSALGMSAYVKKSKGPDWFALVAGDLIAGYHKTPESAMRAAEVEMCRRAAENQERAVFERIRALRGD